VRSAAESGLRMSLVSAIDSLGIASLFSILKLYSRMKLIIVAVPIDDYKGRIAKNQGRGRDSESS